MQAPPTLRLCSPQHKTTWDPALSSLYFDALASMVNEGVSFEGKVALVTGCSKGSIGIKIVAALLTGGATVVATTSSFARSSTLDYFRTVFEENGSKGSSLTVLPFNQASRQDCRSLVDWIYNVKALDLDIVVPFAAISENGRDIGNIDDRSELAHRLMLTNLTRLLGHVKAAKGA